MRLQNLQLLFVSTCFLLEMRTTKTTQLYDKLDGFGFHILNFSFISSQIPSALVSLWCQCILVHCYALCYSNYSDFLSCHMALRTKLYLQSYKVTCLCDTVKKFYDKHTDLVGQYKKNVCQMFADSIS